MNLCGQDGDIWKLLDYRFSSWGIKTYQKGLGESEEFILKIFYITTAVGLKIMVESSPTYQEKPTFFYSAIQTDSTVHVMYSKHAYIEEITESPSCTELKDSENQTAPGLFSKTSTVKIIH